MRPFFHKKAETMAEKWNMFISGFFVSLLPSETENRNVILWIYGKHIRKHRRDHPDIFFTDL